MDVLFKNQEKWASSNDPPAAVGQYAALAGIDKPTYEKCVSDEAAIDRILAQQVDGRDRSSVPSTHTFVVKGKPFLGKRLYEDFNGIPDKADTTPPRRKQKN